MAAAWNDLPATGGLHECAALVSSAEALRVSAPELSVQLAQRALLVGATHASADTGEVRNLVMRAQAVLAAGLVRISQHAKAVEPGFAALALAEAGGAADIAASVRIDLAACAQQVGEPLLGGALLRPVLEAGQVPPAVRAAALGRLVGCVAHAARRDDVEDALTEADRLLAADSGIAADVRRMERARLAVRMAGYHRWYGDTEDAITAAREGLALLTRLRPDLRSESDRLRARLVLELVCGLLDEGELHEALNAAHPTVDEPVRATSAASVGRLMLALATRVYLPSGQMDRGRHLLDQAAWLAERHTLDGLRADALTEVSRLEEQAGRAADALEAMRAARAAEHRRMRAVSRAARIVLVEVGANHGVRDTTQQSVAALMRQLAHPAGLPVAMAPRQQVAAAQQKPHAEPQTPSAAPELGGTVDMEKDTRLLDREGLIRRLRAVRTGERPVALTLVRFEPNKGGDRGPDTGIMAGLADKVRGMAPDNAELARSDGGELAVILPATTRDQAEEFAATIRESDWASAGGKDMSISTGVVQADQTASDDRLDPTGMLIAARDALTAAQPPANTNPRPDAAAAQRPALSEETPTTPLNQERQADPRQPGRSILSSLSIPTGSGGRRRAGEEQPPGAKSRWPAEPTEAPRWTRAERRAQAEANQSTDWPPTTDEPSQGKRAATPTKPSFSESRIGEATAGIDRTRFPARHSTPQETPAIEAASEPGLTTRRTLQSTQAPQVTGTAEPSHTPGETTVATPRATRRNHEASHPTALNSASGNEASHSAPPAAESQDEASRSALLATGSTDVARHFAPAGTRDASRATSLAGGSRDEGGRSGLSAIGSGDEPGHSASPSAGAGDAASRATSLAGGGRDEGSRSGLSAIESRDESRHSASPSAGAGDAASRFASLAGGSRDEAGRSGLSAIGSGDEPGHSASPSAGAGDAASRFASLAGGSRDEASLSASFGAGRGDEPRHSASLGADAAEDAGRSDSPGERASSASVAGTSSSGSQDAADASGDDAFFSSLAGLSTGGMLRGAETSESTPRTRSSYEETKAELARMMSALNAKSAAARERNGARQSPPTPPAPDAIPEPPARPEVPEPPRPDPVPPVPSEPEVGGRSRLMAAFDALTGPVPGLRAEFDDAPELPARKPAESWAQLESSSAVDSPADALFGTEAADTDGPRSSLGAAFAEFGTVEKKVTEPVKEPVQETSYDAPIGPEPRPDDLPRRGERSSATLASLLTEALAAYQSTAEDAEVPPPSERSGSYASDDADRQQSGASGRHRSLD